MFEVEKNSKIHSKSGTVDRELLGQMDEQIFSDDRGRVHLSKNVKYQKSTIQLRCKAS